MVSSSSIRPSGHSVSVNWTIPPRCPRSRRSPKFRASVLCDSPFSHSAAAHPPPHPHRKPSFGKILPATATPAITVSKQDSSPKKLVLRLRIGKSSLPPPTNNQGENKLISLRLTPKEITEDAMMSGAQIRSERGKLNNSASPTEKNKEEKKKIKKPFSFRLSKEEAAEDLMLLTGGKRLPRPKMKVSKQLRAERERLIPGLLLC